MAQALQRIPVPKEVFVLSEDNFDAVLAGAINELMSNSSDRPNLEICINFFTKSPPPRFNKDEAGSRLQKLREAIEATSDTDEHRWKRSSAASMISSARVTLEWLK